MNKSISKINEILPMGKEFEQIEALLMLPDEKFDQIYPDLKIQLNKVFKSKAFQEEILNQISMIPLENTDEEKGAFNDFINEIKNEFEFSENKKDLLINLIEKSILTAYEMIKNPRERVTVKIERIDPNAKIPQYAHPTDAGADVFALEDTIIHSNTTKLIRTGIKVAIPVGYEIQVRPRSGLSLKTGLRIANAPGTIDADYRGEVCIIMTNIGINDETIKAGDKIAQLVIAPTPMIIWEEGNIEDDTERGKGGFGSTDNN